MTDMQRYTPRWYADEAVVMPDPEGLYVLASDAETAIAAARAEPWTDCDATDQDFTDTWGRVWVRKDRHEAAIADAEQRGRDEQRANDYVTLWSRLMLEDRKARPALARAALILRGRWTDRDILTMTGKVVSLHEWETVKPVPDAYQQGQRDMLAKALREIDLIDSVDWALNPHDTVVAALRALGDSDEA